ncbi:MAG: hypothetical protein H7Y88_08095 [Phycisphaerales bacterium]|nr:hypothetical protein [Phycisphaerales bacterium]
MNESFPRIRKLFRYEDARLRFETFSRYQRLLLLRNAALMSKFVDGLAATRASRL